MVKKIFIPQCCVNAESGLLIGIRDPDLDAIYIVALVHFPVTPKQLNQYLQRKKQTGNVVPVGTWVPSKQAGDSSTSYDDVLPKLFGQKSWICLEKFSEDANSIIVSESELVEGNNSIISGGSNFMKVDADTMLVLYNQKKIWESNYDHKSIHCDTDCKRDVIGTLCEKVQSCKNGLLSYDSISEEETLKVTHCCMERELSLVYFMLSLFTRAFLGVIYLVAHQAQKVYDYCRVLHPVFKFVFSIFQMFSLVSHTCKKVSNFHKSILEINEKDEEMGSKVKDKNVIASFFMDAFLGITTLLILFRYGILYNQSTKQVLLPSVEWIAGQVEELIKWLMGIPAGLKLNDPLNQFLGHFFLYHVRLWLEYARLMMDVFPHLMTYCLLSLCFGMSFFLSIISDTVSTLSFHVYCFYVYAGRLYGLQIKGLTSLWRLFRGKKWNPLRKRVDSLEGSGADQLFVGTLFFTVLLFLLPTTVLYYAIFVLLRVAVLTIQIFLSGLIFFFSEYPWYSMFLRAFQPNKFVKSFHCKWADVYQNTRPGTAQPECHLAQSENEALIFELVTSPQSYGEVIMEGFRSRSQSQSSFDPKPLLSKMVSGELIRWS